MDTATKTPWHLWVIGVVSLLWNSIGAADYIFSSLRSEAWFKMMQYPEAGIAYLDQFPAWAHGGWALGTLGAFLGSILLLARSRHAFAAFAISLLGIALTTVYEAGANMPPELAEVQPAWFPIVLWAIAILLFVYSWMMKKRGVLK
ncbi:hypothetical protein [Qipengyuania gelatinilytica]|uniref:Sugar transporter n=1 Tax=Qipengyuania gelatinilytica TaxID=2867231 RepID=A0ABX9A810_9SPHN|nr:hypothetical protein [Qipengyuania gelatinilytica]QZD96043.1 hypothetical protein K3136_04870 [Qipengyuania gelatinilytica]